MGDYVLQRVRDTGELVQRAGPYVLLEILLPGGTLFALLLFCYRRSHPATAGVSHWRVAFGWLLGRLEEALDLRVVAGPRADPADGLGPLGLAPDA